MKKLIGALIIFYMTIFAKPTFSKESVKAKFYDFSDTVIDGEIKKPTNLFIDVKQKATFDRLLRLKKGFLNDVLATSKDRAFQ